MTKKKIQLKGKCAPMLWKKMSKLEQKLWADLYEVFIIDQNFHIDWSKGNHEQKDVTAHNMACQALWLLKSYIL